MITTLEGQTVWVTQEPTLAEVTSGNYVLPVNFKVVDATNNTYKTVSYVFDSVNGARRLESGGGNYIPLTGTEEGKPVAGHIYTDPANVDGGILKIFGLNESFIGFDEDGQIHINSNGVNQTFGSNINLKNLILNGDTLKCFNDFSETEPENKLVIAQRSYVDKANSYSLDETKTGGTWIDGRPIYRKVITKENLSTTAKFLSWDITGTNVSTLLPVDGSIHLDTSPLNTDFVGLTSVTNTGMRVPIQSYYQKDDENNEALILSCNSDSNLPVGKYYIVLEYTKTTDTSSLPNPE